jgi:hypothetical protein
MGNNEVGCIYNETAQLEQMFYGLDNPWAQITYLTGDTLEIFYRICRITENYNKLGFEIINQCISAGAKFDVRLNNKLPIMDIDKSTDIARAKKIR